MDTSTLIVVFLLVTAASLASYALSHWSSIRGALGVGWAATSIGTTMLLVAAAIVVLTFVFRGPLWRPNLAMEQRLRATAVASKEISPREIAASALQTSEASTSNAPATSERQRVASAPASAARKEQAQRSAALPLPELSIIGRSWQPLPTFKGDDPWAATRCVHIYHPGSDPTQWKIENECHLPVGVSVSGCDPGPGTRNCGPMIFPSKLQRPIPLEEQTVYGYDIRYVACFAASPSVVYLIGAPSEERATDTWREQFEAARASDGCLLSIRY